MAEYKIVIENKQAGNLQFPVATGEITITWYRDGAPGRLVCNLVNDENLNYQEGNTLAFYVDDKLFFYGYVFSKKRTSEQIIKTTCYDQLVYLKNKSTLQYEDWTYSELLENICNDRHLQIGDIDNTEIKIPARAEINKEYYDMLQFASDFTTANSNKIFVLFDQEGKINLKNIENMKTKGVIDYGTTEDYDYSTSINENTYNRVHLKLLDDANKEIKSATAEDQEHIAEWGILSYYDMTNNAEIDIEKKAKELLKLLNRKYRRLKIRDAIGMLDVRAGSLVPVQMAKIGDININGYMLVQSVTHTFQEEHHTMDLEVYNADIMPQIQPPQMDKKKSASQEGAAPTGEGAQGAMDYLKNQIGALYSQAKRLQPGYYDCSSAVMRAYQSVGLLPTRGYNLTTRSIHTDPHFQEININQLQPGDVAWKNGHMEMYVGNGKTLGAHKPGTPLGYAPLGNRFTRYYRIRGDS